MTDKEQIIRLSLDLISCFLILGEKFKLSDKSNTYIFHRPIPPYQNLQKGQITIIYQDGSSHMKEFDLYNRDGFYWLRLDDILLKIGNPLTIEIAKSFGDKAPIEYSDGSKAHLIRTE